MKRGLSRKSIHPAPDFWYYEMRGGLHCYYGSKGRAGELVAIIPWRKLAASLKRKQSENKQTP